MVYISNRKWLHICLRISCSAGSLLKFKGDIATNPQATPIAQLIERLNRVYQERRVAVTTEIFSKPIDFVKAFADAFRLRKEK